MHLLLSSVILTLRHVRIQCQVTDFEEKSENIRPVLVSKQSSYRALNFNKTVRVEAHSSIWAFVLRVTFLVCLKMIKWEAYEEEIMREEKSR